METQVRQALVMMSFEVGTVARWLCRNPHLLYRCPYLTLQQQLSTAYQNYAYRITSIPRLRNLWKQRATEVDPTPYSRVRKTKAH